MNMTHPQRFFVRFLFALVIGGVAAAFSPGAHAAGATVTGLLGLAQYARAGGEYTPVKVGTVLQPGDVVQTATGSALDLDLGKVHGTIRLLQSTTLGLTTLSADEVLLDLKGGEVLSERSGKGPNSKLKVEVPSGIAGIVDGRFRLNARGYLVLIEGTAMFVEAGAGDPAVHVLNGTVFYSPIDHAVRPAPKELERELRAQLKARVPKK